jgi:hypothetical protein
MKTITVSVETFTKMLLELIQSGVTFEATENTNETITIDFTGGY